MIYFINDYSDGAHSAVLEHLVKTNFEKLSAYGNDFYSVSAAKKIKMACDAPDAEVFFLTGGTQTNRIVVDSLLKPYEGVISANTSHINGHEAGAIENTGHKVISLPHKDGKLRAEDLLSYIEDFYKDENRAHMVFPGMVYISHPTEYGTLYTHNELKSLSEVCCSFNIPLYMDGARLGYALACSGNSLSLPEIAKLCDVFYIGGTKVGALCGEALVFTKSTPSHFPTRIKQHGAMLAKSRLIGVQFDALFTDDLYINIGRNAVECADMIRSALKCKGYKLFMYTPANQIFVILDNESITRLRQDVKFELWGKYDESSSVVRFVTSWATSKEDTEKLIKLL